MLSVANLPSGAQIEVTVSWAATLTLVDGLGHLRIPLTVGDVYGQSGLLDSDELIHAGSAPQVQLSVHCNNGLAEIRGATLVDDRAEVPGNAPIDLTVRNWTARPLAGRTADGREVSLLVNPCNPGTEPLDVVIVVDRSGSMAQMAEVHSNISKHKAAVGGLQELASSLTDTDRVKLIEFSDLPKDVVPKRGAIARTIGELGNMSPKNKLIASIKALSPPNGGTEIGLALNHALSSSDARDVLLITDGKSHALDVQSLVGKGKRISVVLVGEDSLEANVGRLAFLSGGDLLVAPGDNLQDTILAAASALRLPFKRLAKHGSEIEEVTTVQGNASLIVHWGASSLESEEPQVARAVAAITTWLALPMLTHDAATKTAVAEGLVTHLTSLVLIDEESLVGDSLPATRKIPLPRPRVADSGSHIMPAQLNSPMEAGFASFAGGADEAYLMPAFLRRESDSAASRLMPSQKLISDFRVDGIDWDLALNELANGDLGSLDPEIRETIERKARSEGVLAISHLLRIDPIRLVIAAMALIAASRSRSADRVARNILGKGLHLDFDEIAAALVRTVRP